MPKELSYLDAIREALAEEMRRDPKVFVLGEDVGPYGGAFGATQGLYEEFGEIRVVDTPISESAIVGISIGAAMRGYRPVAEMQFADFISCGFDQIVNQAATLRYRYGGRASVPIVVRAPSGGNVGGGLYHSQNPEGWFIHRAGLKVVAPSTAYDAKGLLKAAIRDDNPVVYFEHKYLYRRVKGPGADGDGVVPIGGAVGGGLYHSKNPEGWFIPRAGLKVVAPSTAYDAKGLLKAAIRDDNPVVYFEHKYLYRRVKGPVPDGDEIVPIGVAATRREGSDLTLLTYGAMALPSLDAADRLAKEGVEVEVN